MAKSAVFTLTLLVAALGLLTQGSGTVTYACLIGPNGTCILDKKAKPKTVSTDEVREPSRDTTEGSAKK
jgi:hypothetical protein